MFGHFQVPVGMVDALISTGRLRILWLPIKPIRIDQKKYPMLFSIVIGQLQ